MLKHEDGEAVTPSDYTVFYIYFKSYTGHYIVIVIYSTLHTTSFPCSRLRVVHKIRDTLHRVRGFTSPKPETPQRLLRSYTCG